MTTATAYTFDNNVVSDLHKDAYGFRPSQSFWEYWTAADQDGKQRIWDDLCDSLQREMEYQHEQEARAVEDFNDMLQDMYELGAKDFAQALKWIHDANNSNGDDDHLEYFLGLPYGHIAKARESK